MRTPAGLVERIRNPALRVTFETERLYQDRRARGQIARKIKKTLSAGLRLASLFRLQCQNAFAA
jgi:hypothetical protein